MPKQNLAIALCRVSSLEQLQSNSLSHQRDNVLRAADQLNVRIPDDGIWSGHVSSKKGVNYDRKDLKQMLEYCHKHPSVKYLIVQEVDRFMRSPDEQVYFQVRFMQEVGVKIWYADKPGLNNDDTLSGLMRYLEGFRAAGSNDERQRKSINGQTKALEEGRFPFAPKPGYKKGLRTGIQEIHEVRGPALKNVLLRLASRLITPSEAVVELNASAFVKSRALYKMDKFRKIATDPFYAGIVEIDKQVKMRNENGLHQALISKEQHRELVRIMDGKKKNQSGPRKNGNPKYPLSNHVSCDLCIDKRNGRYVGYDHGNGHSNKIYEKYRCRACKRRITRDELHTQILKQFEAFSVSDEALKGLVDALNIVWKQKEGEAGQEAVRITRLIQNINTTIDQQVEAATDPSNLSIKEDILSAITKKKTEVIDLENQLETLSLQASNDKDRFLRFAFDFVENMGNRFLEISPENRLRCKQVLFPAGFYLDAKNKVHTPEISPFYRLISNKKDLSEPEKSLLVRVRSSSTL